MEEIQARFIPKTYYNGMILLCFLSCAGVSCVVFYALPPIFQDGKSNEPGYITFVVINLVLSSVILIFSVYVGWLIKNKAKFHRNQEVFWPTQCRHCALVIGLQHAGSSSPALKHNKREQFQQKSIPRRWSLPDNLNSFKGSMTKYHMDNSTIMSSELFMKQSNSPSNQRIQFIYKKPHKSLLLLFYIFGSLALIEAPLELVGNSLCFTDSGRSVLSNVALVAKTINIVAQGTAFLFSMLFFNTYYDAVIIAKAKFSIGMSIFFALSITNAALRIGHPITERILPVYDPLKDSCDLNTTIQQLVIDQEEATLTMRTEVSIIAVGILSHIWRSMIPQCFLETPNVIPEFDYFEAINKRPLSQRLLQTLKNGYLKIKLSFWRTMDNDQYLLQEPSRRCRNSPSLRLFYILTIVLSTMYVSLYLYTFKSNTIEYQSTKSYIELALRMSFYLPFIGLYHFQIFLAGNSKTILLRDQILGNLIQNHDIVLMFSAGGIFMRNVFRLVAAIGILMRPFTIYPDETALASYSILYSAYQVYCIWTMTSFLLTVQRRRLTSDAQVKWVSICLMFTMSINGTNWLVDLFHESSWFEFKTYYGLIGTVIGGSIEPLHSLFNLHAVMIAYGTYQGIRKDT